MSKREPTKDAVEILRRRYIGEDPERLASVEEERVHAKVARQIYDLRNQAGLTQSELAEKVGTTQSAISRLESADYEGHSLSMLRRIGEVLGAKVDVDLGERDRTVKPFVFRTFVQYLRREKGFTLDQVADETDIPREVLAAIEQQEGFRPSPRTVYQLSRFYRLSPVKLAALAGASGQPVDEVREPVHKFAAMSESFSKLSKEERRALKELVTVLREETAE
jgi:transcriptional regulator with XRE-family HTH domain